MRPRWRGTGTQEQPWPRKGMEEKAMRSIGIDLGGHFIKGALVVDGAVTRRDKVPTPQGRSPESVVMAISSMAESLDPGNTALRLGVGFPGMLDPGREKVLQAPNFPMLENYPFRSRVSRACGRDVYLENDASCAALGEWNAGAAKGLTDFVMFTLGTGIGGGIISGGRLIRGSHGKAGELGHLAVGDKTTCGCGASRPRRGRLRRRRPQKILRKGKDQGTTSPTSGNAGTNRTSQRSGTAPSTFWPDSWHQ